MLKLSTSCRIINVKARPVRRSDELGVCDWLQFQQVMQMMQQVFIVIGGKPFDRMQILGHHHPAGSSSACVCQNHTNMFIDESPKFDKVIYIVVLVVADLNPFVLVVHDKGLFLVLPNYKTTNIALGRINQVTNNFFTTPLCWRRFGC